MRPRRCLRVLLHVSTLNADRSSRQERRGAGAAEGTALLGTECERAHSCCAVPTCLEHTTIKAKRFTPVTAERPFSGLHPADRDRGPSRYLRAALEARRAHPRTVVVWPRADWRCAANESGCMLAGERRVWERIRGETVWLICSSLLPLLSRQVCWSPSSSKPAWRSRPFPYHLPSSFIHPCCSPCPPLPNTARLTAAINAVSTWSL